MPRANPGNTLGYRGIIENQFKSWMKIPIILIFYVFNLKPDIFLNLQERKHVIKPVFLQTYYEWCHWQNTYEKQNVLNNIFSLAHYLPFVSDIILRTKDHGIPETKTYALHSPWLRRKKDRAWFYLVSPIKYPQRPDTHEKLWLDSFWLCWQM
jgi:hypothetical protein